MPEPSIFVSRHDAVATVTINRADTRNVLDMDMAVALRAAMDQVAIDPDVRAVVLQGAGKHFMVGGDIRWFRGLLNEEAGARRLQLNRMIDEVHGAIARIRTMDKPVLASVRGAAAGFGLSLMAACDLAVADDTAFFTLAYSGLGTSPDGGSTYSLPRLVGPKVAMELALLNERIDAARARELGLINRVAAPDALESLTAELASRLAAGPTAAFARTKGLLNESLEHSLSDQLQAEERAFLASSMTEDFAEGVRAFVEKRNPLFKGR
ncbi:MAG TPA: enoyl-CoA hydratase-related protein [Noviherbaspirillum sp.]|nr:enoyl-CoA hydratase-related protein [Noviherbaspirillum sp.]